MTTQVTPLALGYRMPAEWAPHTRCWMAWPCREKTWRGGLEQARQAYAEIARAIAEFEPVTMLARSEDAVAAANLCGATVHVETMPLDDSWTRDTGPTFVVDATGKVAACNWKFNSWGGNNTDTIHDAMVAERVAELAGVERLDAPFVLEGGAVHVDGEGTAATTESVLLNKNRNATWTKADAEQALQDWLGVTHVIWLEGGLDGDETDGHVDNVACFAAPGRILMHTCDDATDPNHDVLTRNLDILKMATDASGRSIDVIPVPLPDPLFVDGQRLTASYLNFYLPNGGVILPSFGGKKDAQIFELISDVFPNRQVVQIDARNIVRGGGGIHCITQQQPDGFGDAQ